jgi:hypothetical protein
MNASGGCIGAINPLDIQDSFPYRHSAEERLLVNPTHLTGKEEHDEGPSEEGKGKGEVKPA